LTTDPLLSFQKLHGVVRPLSLKKETIKRRNRAGKDKDVVQVKPAKNNMSTKRVRHDNDDFTHG
jgi:hypothetical protein